MSETLPYFMYKGRRSIDYGLIIKKKSIYKGSQRDVTFVNVPGRDGDLIIDNGRYKNTTITYELAVVNGLTPWSFAELAQILRSWLIPNTGYFKLWDTYDKQHFRYAAFNGDVNIEQELNDLGAVSLDFNCKPHRYAVEGQNVITMESGGDLYNGEAVSSEPYIKIYGSGDITLTVNSETFVLEDVSGSIEIDSELMDVFKGSTLMNGSMMSTSFPVLQPGMNTISWTGGSVSKIEIVPRWRCL